MHSSELRWISVASEVSNVASGLLEVVNRAEERYQELLEAYTYSGGTDLGFAELLFYGTIGGVNVPTADEISKITDLRNAMVAAHNLFQALNSVAVGAEDRATALRRMS